MLEEVAQPFDLSFLFVGDRNGRVDALEHGTGPVMQSAQLLREVRVEELHERSELLFGVGDDEKVVVVREENAEYDAKAIVALGPAQGPFDRQVHLGGRSQEKPTLNRFTGDLDETTREQTT